MELNDVIVCPVVTEKSREVEQSKKGANRYCFKVQKNANKELIRQALYKLYDVKVVKVNTMVVAGKYRKFKRERIKLPTWKKAIVELAPGQSLDLKVGV